MASWFNWGGSKTVRSNEKPLRHVCRCGLAKDVIRADQIQRLTCSACGELGILLPRDVYLGSGPQAETGPSQPAQPTPKTRSSRPGAARSRRANTTAGRARPASNDTTKPTTASKSNTTPPQPARKLKSESPPKAVAEPAEPAEPLVTRRGIQSESSYAPHRRRVTPFRLVAVSMLVVIGLTGWWSVRQYRLSRDAGQLGEWTRKGLESFESGAFTVAAADLGRAADVLDRLGRDDPVAAMIRQRSREAEAAGGVVSESLVEILDTADRIGQSGSADAWQSQFDRDHRGRWIVMQSILEPQQLPMSAAGAGAGLDEREGKPEPVVGGFEAEFPFAVGDRLVRLVGRLPDLALLPDWGDPAKGSSDDPIKDPANEGPLPVIFAAQLEAIHLDSDTDTWRIELTAGTSFLWSDIGSLRHLGFLSGTNPDADLDVNLVDNWAERQISRILKLQAQAIGLGGDSVSAVSRVRALPVVMVGFGRLTWESIR